MEAQMLTIIKRKSKLEKNKCIRLNLMIINNISKINLET